MSRFLTLLVALCMGLLFTGSPAQAAEKPLTVSKAMYHEVTQDHLSKCGTIDANGLYTPPAIPADIQAAVDADRLRGYHRVTHANLTGNGLPTVYYRANRATVRYINVGGTLVATKHTARVHRAWVPGFAGDFCNKWTVIQYKS